MCKQEGFYLFVWGYLWGVEGEGGDCGINRFHNRVNSCGIAQPLVCAFNVRKVDINYLKIVYNIANIEGTSVASANPQLFTFRRVASLATLFTKEKNGRKNRPFYNSIY